MELRNSPPHFGVGGTRGNTHYPTDIDISISHESVVYKSQITIKFSGSCLPIFQTTSTSVIEQLASKTVHFEDTNMMAFGPLRPHEIADQYLHFGAV